MLKLRGIRPLVRRFLLCMQENTCFYCFTEITEKTATIDHFVPLSLGGDDEQTNMVACCRRCNQRKGNMMPIIFMRKLRNKA